MKRQWPVNVLKVEERFVLVFQGRDDQGQPILERKSTGWWLVLETHPHISVYLGDERPSIEPNQSLTLTLESQP